MKKCMEMHLMMSLWRSPHNLNSVCSTVYFIYLNWVETEYLHDWYKDICGTSSFLSRHLSYTWTGLATVPMVGFNRSCGGKKTGVISTSFMNIIFNVDFQGWDLRCKESWNEKMKWTAASDCKGEKNDSEPGNFSVSVGEISRRGVSYERGRKWD